MLKESPVFFLVKLFFGATILAIIALVVFAPKHVALSAPSVTTLNFEDLSAGTNVTTQYAGRGVLFPRGAFVDADPAARSGTRVLRAGNPTKEFHQGSLVIQFTSGQARVSLFAGTTLFTVGDKVKGTLRAFNSTGAMISQDGPKPVAPKKFTTAFEVKVSGPFIMRIELEMESTEFEAIDDLEFEGEAAAPTPSAVPLVQITSPANNAQLDVSTVTVQGVVTGTALMPTATLKLQVRRPPESTAPPFTTSVPLSGSGTNRTFTVPLAGLGFGPLVLTLEAENTGGLKGIATVQITNLPAAIRSRYAADGAMNAFGDFRWGTSGDGCKMAVYERGAISVEGSATRVIRGSIFNKWLSLRGPFNSSGWFGCPTGEERAAPGGAKEQDFRKGRIYAGLPDGAHYVPSVFAQAIDQLGGEGATGVPIGDPRNSTGVMQTWLFQQFARPGKPGLPSTLEIRGVPPKLYVERQGGDLSELSAVGSGLTGSSPAIWQQFPCSGNEGPCNIPHPPGPPAHIQNAGNQFCDGFIWPTAPEWKAILGDSVLTPIVGIVKDSSFADKDNPATHDVDCLEFVPKLDFWNSTPSDWRVYVRPFLPHRGVEPYPSLFAGNSDNIVELEFEYCRFHTFGLIYSKPQPGDLIFASGRWVIDCGHLSYNAEIHPPAVMAYMRTEMHNGHLATAAVIWVNGWYTGGPVEFDIFPPPRPSPNATLVIEKPVDRDAAWDVNINSPFSVTNARVSFTAPYRPPIVHEDSGEMIWQYGRAYYGRWHVYWSD